MSNDNETTKTNVDQYSFLRVNDNYFLFTPGYVDGLPTVIQHGISKTTAERLHRELGVMLKDPPSLVIKDPPSFLDEALNSGDGSYKP